MTKTNKSFTKRLKITKTGKILAHKKGWGHFNAKESREDQFKKKKWYEITLKQKIKNKFLPF